MSEPFNNPNIQLNIDDKKTVGRPLGSKNKSKKIKIPLYGEEQNENPFNEEKMKHDKLLLFQDITKMYSDFSKYLKEYQIKVNPNSTIEQLKICLIDMEKIIISKQTQNIPTVMNSIVMIIGIFEKKGFISNEFTNKFKKFTDLLIENYTDIEPEINEMMSKYPRIAKTISNLPCEISLASKLWYVWLSIDDPNRTKKFKKVDTIYDDL